MSDWTDEELEASVKAYREMERLHAENRAYSKKDFYSKLAERFPRSAKAFEYRMQNISAVLHENGEPWIPGLKPAGNVGANVAPKIQAMLRKHPKLNQRSLVQAAYKAKLPAIRQWLIRVARSRRPVTYGEVMAAFGIDRFSLRHAMDYLGHQAENAGEPILTALVVGKKTGRCHAGFAIEFNIADDEAERQRLYEFWKVNEPESTDPVGVSQGSLEVRSARFASVEVRPDQAAFRRLVYSMCDGRCVITGCDVLQVLDAAHKSGRSWRLGHNLAEDGYIMRKDLHALYDARLLKIDADWTIWIDPSIVLHYGELAGRKIHSVCASPTDKAEK
jgi:hypothetical protein